MADVLSGIARGLGQSLELGQQSQQYRLLQEQQRRQAAQQTLSAWAQGFNSLTKIR
jgi:hypothetical protein